MAGTDLHLKNTLYEVAAQPIDGQRTDNAANQYPLQYCKRAHGRDEMRARARQYSADNKNRGLARVRKQNKRHRMKPVAPRAALTPTQPGQRNTTAEQQHSCTTLFFSPNIGL